MALRRLVRTAPRLCPGARSFGSPSDRSAIADWGVPETWTAMDVYTDGGYFDEDTFPPALDGETLIDYCKRVPNVWSPCSRADDVVDVRVSWTLEFAQDWSGEDHQFNERPILKLAPNDSSLLAFYQEEADKAIAWTDLMTDDEKARFDPEEPERIRQILEKSITKRCMWFKAETFDDWWEELTGEKSVPSSIAPRPD